MKNVSIVAAGMVLLVSSFALSARPTPEQAGLKAGFDGDPLPPACFPKNCSSMPHPQQ